MTELKDLNLDQIDLPDGSTVKLAIVVTLKADDLEDKSERKINRVWEIFRKNFSKSKDDYQAVEIESTLPENDPFKEKRKVFAIDLTSFGKIEPKQEKELDFGLRLVQNDENILLIDESMQDKNNKKNLDNGIEFAEVEEDLDSAHKYIQSLAETKRFEYLRDQKEDSYNQRKMEEQEAKENSVKENNVVSAKEVIEQEEGEEYNNIDEDIDNEAPTDTNHQAQLEDDAENADKDISETDNEASDEMVELDDSEEYYNRYDIENLKQILLDNLEYYIPKYDLKELNNDVEIPEIDNVEYKNLHQATVNAVNNKIEQANKSINTVRDRSINNLYRDLRSELVRQYFEAEALYNYSVEGSEFNNIYQKLNNNLSEAEKNIKIQADEQEKIKKQKHETDKEIYLNNLLKTESAKYDEENLPKIKEEVENFKNTSNEDVNNKYAEQIEQLEEDIDRTVTERMDRLIDNVIKEHKQQLDNEIDKLNETMGSKLDVISTEIKKDWEKYKDQLKDIEEIRTKEQNSQQSKIDEEVSNRTKYYEEMKNKLEERERHIDMLQSNLRKEKESNVQKDYSLDSASVERQNLLDRADKKEQEVAKLEKRLQEKDTQIQQLSSSANYLSYPFNRAPKTKMEKSKSKVREWYDSFEKLIIAVVASIIIAIAVLVASSVISANQSDHSQEQQDIQKQEEKIKSQQQEQEDRQKQLDDKQKEQEDKQQELDKQEQENKKSESKKDDKKKDKD